MILDQVFYGVLNEKAGTLEVFEEAQGEVRQTEPKKTRLTEPGASIWGARDDEADG